MFAPASHFRSKFDDKRLKFNIFLLFCYVADPGIELEYNFSYSLEIC